MQRMVLVRFSEEDLELECAASKREILWKD